MKIYIPLENTFQVPEGNYRAILIGVHHLAARGKVRFLFEIINEHPRYGRYVAGKNYEINLAKGSQLREDLQSWRGFDLTSDELEAGAIDFDLFVGKEADLQIKHISNDSHKDPFCHIAGMFPPGTLVQEPAQPVLAPAFGGKW